MNSDFILWSVGVLAVAAFIVVLIIQYFKSNLTDTVSEMQTETALFSDSDVGKNLRNFVAALENNTPDVAVFLEKLKNNSAECARELSDSFSKLPENAYSLKWLIVYCASQFEMPEFMALLKTIAESRIPPEKSEHLHLYSTTAHEMSIRLRAVDGLKVIARTGNKEAESTLIDLLKSTYISLSIAACQGLCEIDADNRNRISALLPLEKQFILDIKPKHIQDIPFIKEEERNHKTAGTPIPKPYHDKNNIPRNSSAFRGSRPPKTRQTV